MSVSIDKSRARSATQPELSIPESSSRQETESGVGQPKEQVSPPLPPAVHTPARVIRGDGKQTGAKPLDLQVQRNLEVSPLDPAFIGLEPRTVWRHFHDLTRIPRGSGNEAAVRSHIEAWAVARGFQPEVDATGNLLVRVNAQVPGPIVGLQGHLDMVCVAEDDLQIDFKRDPIPVVREGDEITAEGTSLGADNGIGIAYAMALAEECAGPLELLFTIDEENGFTGVDGVKPGWLRCSEMLNLDSEEEGFFTIACAGGRDFVVEVPVAREPAVADLRALHLSIDGLKGGHSGIEIHRGRTNAIKAMGEVLAAVRELGGVLYGIRGGSKRNVIPFSSHATVGLPADAVPALEARLARLHRELSSPEDPDLNLGLEPTRADRDPMTGDAFSKMLSLVEALPSGVIKATDQDPDQPLVSNNLAIVEETASGDLRITNMSRSPSQAELDAVEARIAGMAQDRGATSRADGGYVGWEADYDSPLLATCLAKYREVFGREAKVLEIHAGLECGAIKAKYPDLNVISFGPNIHGAHTTHETVSVTSSERTYGLLRAVVAELHGHQRV